MTFPSPDGTPVPATVVRHRDTPLDGSAPALLYGYGAYEATDDPAWDPALPSLLDAGVVFVHAHVRGGGEGGRRWWIEGHLEQKQNTFTDHLAVADGVAGSSTAPASATRGLSAGGLLQGAVLSQRPDRWRAVVAEVPVRRRGHHDARPVHPPDGQRVGRVGRPAAQGRTSTGCSPTRRTTTCRRPARRPDLLVTGALHDPRVMVHEPAKWVAALRESDPEWSPRCVFRVETGAGAHAGPSGRYRAARLRGRGLRLGAGLASASLLTRESVTDNV